MLQAVLAFHGGLELKAISYQFLKKVAHRVCSALNLGINPSTQQARRVCRRAACPGPIQKHSMIENQLDPESEKRGLEWLKLIQKKARLEPRCNGHTIVIDIETGEYLIGPDAAEVVSRATAQLGGRKVFIHRCEFF